MWTDGHSLCQLFNKWSSKKPLFFCHIAMLFTIPCTDVINGSIERFLSLFFLCQC